MLQMLSQANREKIHQTGKRILNEVGVVIHDKTVCNLLQHAGALPHETNPERLYFPPSMVDKYLPLCPNSFTIKDRMGNVTHVKNGARPLYYTSNGTHYVKGTGKKAADISTQHLVDFIRVADKMDNIDGVVGTSVIDYVPAMRDIAGFRLMAQHSYKHLRPCIYTPAGAEAIIEMADVILEGKPLQDNMFFTLGYSIVSPLAWSPTSMQLFYRTRGHKIPIIINSEPMGGATSPVTLAGSLAMADAEIISGIVINQVIEPGRPCLYNAGFAHVMDMMSAMALTGSAENAMLQAAGAEMAAYHNLPCASWALSDAAMLDAQASYEKMNTFLAHTLAGVNMVWGAGNLEASKTICPEALVIDNEIIGNCLRFAKGIEVNDEQLAFDVVKESAFDGGFLEAEHTLEHYREQIRHSPLPNRQARNLWVDKGSLSMEEKAEAIVDGILKDKPECYLTGTQMEKLAQIEKSRSALL